MSKNLSQNYLKLAGCFAFCLLLRLIPFRAPNLEPILAAQMPIARNFGGTSAFFFGFLSLAVFDFITARVGVWTLVTGIVYGLLGVFAYAFFKNREANRRNYVYFAVLGTLFFDAMTGLTIGPIFFGQSFVGAFYGQIPFTLLHLAGNIGLAFFLSPLIDRYLLTKSKNAQVFAFDNKKLLA